MSAPGNVSFGEAEDAADVLMQLASSRQGEDIVDDRPQKKPRISREALKSMICQLEDDPLIEVME